MSLVVSMQVGMARVIHVPLVVSPLVGMARVISSIRAGRNGTCY